MRLTDSLLDTIKTDYPDIRFLESEEFYWSPNKRMITYVIDDDSGFEHLLHEVAHYLLGHASYKKDIQLIKMERDAWRFADDTLAKKYGIEISYDLIQDDLDTYRDWLHARSKCPKCSSTGVQVTREYRCLLCRQEWSANTALKSNLKRTKKYPLPQ